MNEFKNYHPAVNFIYFTAVLLFSMFLMHPACILISLICGILYSLMLNGIKAIKFNFVFLIPMMLTAALINLIFNHEGATILIYLPGGNPLTMESVIYGLSAGMMLAAVISWFSCYNKIMTSDKFIYLFGKVIPSLSLILSMTLRFIPRFKHQLRVIIQTQRCVGRDISQGSILKKVKNGITIMSVMITWALENSIEISDSMRSRGYGLPHRSAFAIYKLNSRDKKAMIYVILCGLYLVIGTLCGGTYFKYFPLIRSAELSVFSISNFTVYLMLCVMPVIIELMEVIKWKYIKSKI